MKFVKPIKTQLSIMETLLIISALDYLIADIERHTVDRAAAERLRQRILNEVGQGAVEIELDDQQEKPKIKHVNRTGTNVPFQPTVPKQPAKKTIKSNGNVAQDR